MWSPICERISLGDYPSCYEELDIVLDKLQEAIWRCHRGEVSDAEIYDTILRKLDIPREYYEAEENRKKKPTYEGDNLKEVLDSIVARLDKLEDGKNI